MSAVLENRGAEGVSYLRRVHSSDSTEMLVGLQDMIDGSSFERCVLRSHMKMPKCSRFIGMEMRLVTEGYRRALIPE